METHLRDLHQALTEIEEGVETLRSLQGTNAASAAMDEVSAFKVDLRGLSESLAFINERARVSNIQLYTQGALSSRAKSRASLTLADSRIGHPS